jgi:uncharacterized BrkB/YihY/UPF0761 family membrane protein
LCIAVLWFGLGGILCLRGKRNFSHNSTTQKIIMTKRLRTAITIGAVFTVFFIIKDVLLLHKADTTKAILKLIATALITGVIMTFIFWLIFPKWYGPKNTPGDE